MTRADWIPTVTSRTGQSANLITGSPSDSVAVYSQDDLDHRIEAAENDPRDLHVTVRPA